MPRRLGCVGKVRVNYGLPRGALNSAVECHLHTVEVAGSNPAAPTNKTLLFNDLLARAFRAVWLGTAERSDTWVKSDMLAQFNDDA